MSSETNPYISPQSNVAIQNVDFSSVQHRVYSPIQGALASFLGGPAVGAYFIATNYRVLNRTNRANKYLIFGFLFTIALVAVSPLLPERTPKYILPLAYSWAVRLIIEKYQFSKEAIASSQNLAFQSNWKVFGFGLLSLMLTLVLVVAIFFLYSTVGIIQDA